MRIATDRATVEEMAAAWDYLMSSTERESAAITKACCWLRDRVEAREAATRVARDKALAVEAENVVQSGGARLMRKGIVLIAAGAVVLVAAAPANAEASRYCGTTADGFPGIRAVGPTTCAFARNVGTAFDRKRVPLFEWRQNTYMPRPTWIRAWSSKMRRSYRMYCRPRSGPSPFVSCTGGNGARVDLLS